MHSIASFNAGTIDGNISCTCGNFNRYVVYPGVGWGRKSVGIVNHDGTKKEWLKTKLLAKFIGHSAAMQNAS